MSDLGHPTHRILIVLLLTIALSATVKATIASLQQREAKIKDEVRPCYRRGSHLLLMPVIGTGKVSVQFCVSPHLLLSEILRIDVML